MEDKNRKLCPETESGLMLYLYGESPDVRAFEAHLQTCEICKEELELHRKTLGKYRNAPSDAALIDIKKVFERAAMPSISDKFVRWLQPAAAMAVAAILVAGFFMLFAPSKEIKEINVAEKIDAPLDDMEQTLAELAYLNPTETAQTNVAVKTDSQDNDRHLDELDGLVSELENIHSDITTF